MLPETVVERAERVVVINACSAMVKSTLFFSMVQFNITRASASLRETEKYRESRTPIKKKTAKARGKKTAPHH